jgi:hypothetical protein
VESLRRAVAESDQRVDLELLETEAGGVLKARVFVRTEAYYGPGGPLGCIRPPIQIPLVPLRVNRYRRMDAADLDRWRRYR